MLRKTRLNNIAIPAFTASVCCEDFEMPLVNSPGWAWKLSAPPLRGSKRETRMWLPVKEMECLTQSTKETGKDSVSGLEWGKG